MFQKIALLIGVITLAALALFSLRHQRYQAMYEMTQLHRQILQTRQALWNQQAQIARQLTPAQLKQALAQAQAAEKLASNQNIHETSTSSINANLSVSPVTGSALSHR